MGFIKAFTGSLSGTFADQWKDFYVPMSNVPETAAIFPAVLKSQNNGRGENYKGNENVITNGSKIVVPEGTALITMENGQITGFIAEPGGFEFRSNDPSSKSMFVKEDGIFGQTIKSTWEKVKFGGQPAVQQLAFYVNLKEIPNNKFGTQSEIYWDDAYLNNTQVGARIRGTYTMKIVNPLLFIKNYVPVRYLQPNAQVFDFQDMGNDAANQLFNDVVSSLGPAFSIYTQDTTKGNRMAKIQGDQFGFAKSLQTAVDQQYNWKNNRGLEIVQVSILSIEYDEDTKELMKDVKKADALAGNRGNSFMQQSLARGMQAMGEKGDATGMAFMGMGVNVANGMANSFQQNPNAGVMNPAYANQGMMNGNMNQGMMNGNMNQGMMNGNMNQGMNNPSDPTVQLLNAKKLLDAGAISQEEFNQLKSKLLGL